VDAEWWSDEAFWADMFDFIFPPEHLALGEGVAASAVALLGLRPPAAIVDLGCGPGRVAVPLAALGFRVIGVELQAPYLERARAAAQAAGVALELRRGDMADLALDGEVDAAVCLFSSFGYFADRARDERVLRAARRALRPGGRFLLETAHRDGVVRLMHVREARAADGRRWREEPRFDPVTGVMEARWTLTAAGAERRFTSRIRMYTATELDEMLRAAGFREVAFHGGLDGSPPSLDRYEIVAVATR
jgi:SAM-dependent methyltransferase